MVFMRIIFLPMISILIPLYNENENVVHYGSTLYPVIDKIAAESGEEFEYVMVDDGSRDSTVQSLQGQVSGRENITLLRHETNRGMGNALRTGIAACSGEAIITMDADLTFRPEDVARLVQKFRETGADCISGSPYLEAGLMQEVTPLRLVLSKTINSLYRILLNSNITCVSPIFRLYRAELFRDLVISSSNFEINAEILSKLIIMRKRVIEVPVPLHRRKYGTSKIRVRKEMKNYLILLYRIFRLKYLHRSWE
jgi:glycosyltransferase involved in cell wall biosynthesis